MNRKKGNISTFLLTLMLLAGLSLLLYPGIANYWNSKHQTQQINSYVEAVSAIDTSVYEAMLDDARNYNRELPERENVFLLSDERKARSEKLLNVTGSGVMGCISIPAINVSLPIYHGTDDAVLQIGVGHLEWTGLPVGGIDTHCVLSGHRGLPSSKLFSDLDDVVEGDVFVIQVLNDVLTYQVDQIRIVLPGDTDDLQIVPGKDLCTLVTCTPYGINTHRLLVRGHRIENLVKSARVVSEAVVIDPLIVAPIVAFPLLFTLVMMVILKKPEHRPPKKRGGS